MNELAQDLKDSIATGAFRVAVDSKNNAFVEQRTIFQFQVRCEVYDWFFNSRTGYRAQFFLSPKIGTAFNERIVSVVSDILERLLPDTVGAKRVKVEFDGEDRIEAYQGSVALQRSQISKSLVPADSKIWICERRYDDLRVEPIFLAAMGFAARNPRLSVPRWVTSNGQGLCAPNPSASDAWLDLKGGFTDDRGGSDQIKSPGTRARQIHDRGWT